MNRSKEVVLVKSRLLDFAVFAFWILVPTAVAWECVLLCDASSLGLWVGPAISSLFAGSFMSHLRARKGLCATPVGLVWTLPSAKEFLGGITTMRLQWNEIESCRHVRVNSKDFPGFSFDALEIQVVRKARRSVSLPLEMTGGQDATAETITVGNESWTWTEEGKGFLDACRNPDGLLNWRRTRDIAS